MTHVRKLLSSSKFGLVVIATVIAIFLIPILFSLHSRDPLSVNDLKKYLDQLITVTDGPQQSENVRQSDCSGDSSNAKPPKVERVISMSGKAADIRGLIAARAIKNGWHNEQGPQIGTGNAIPNYMYFSRNAASGSRYLSVDVVDNSPNLVAVTLIVEGAPFSGCK